jgi:hypothetical protein
MMIDFCETEGEDAIKRNMRLVGLCGRTLVAVGILSFVSGCDMTDGQPPLSKETMRSVLLDLNMAESYSTMVKDTIRGSSSKNPDSLGTYYQAVFKHYGISRDEFDKSMAWYKERPNEMDSLFSGIIPIATRLQAHTDSVEHEKKPEPAPATPPQAKP